MDVARVAIIGCSRIAQRKFLPALLACETAKVQVVASRSYERSQAIAERFGGVPTVGYSEAIRRDDVDVVYISTPNATHPKLIEEAARAGKDVLCEKSLATTFHDAEDAVSEARLRNIALMEGFMYQHHPQHELIRDIIRRGDIGEIRIVKSHFGFPPLPADDIRYDHSLGGGALLDAGTYPLHVCRMILGGQPTVRGAVLSSGNFDVDISGAALLEGNDWGFGQVAFGFEHSYRNYYEVLGSEGTVLTDRAFSVPHDFMPTVRLQRSGNVTEFKIPPADQFRIQLDVFLRGRGDEEQRASWLDEILAQAKLVDSVRLTACKSNE